MGVLLEYITDIPHTRQDLFQNKQKIPPFPSIPAAFPHPHGEMSPDFLLKMHRFFFVFFRKCVRVIPYANTSRIFLFLYPHLLCTMGDFILETVEKEHNRMALNVAALAGDILLASGAEIFRVEETIDRIAHAYGIESCDPFVLSSGFFLTADSNSDQNFAWVRHIPLSATRLDRVTAVNQLSREIEHGSYTPEEAYQKLQEIQPMPAKRNLCQILASGVGSGCFCYLFGGDPVDCIVAFIAGLLLYVYLLCIVKGQLSKIATNISGGMFVTFIAVLIYQLGLGHHLSEIIIGSIIPLVPGVAFTNGIRDIADQDYIAGAVRMLDALLVTFSIAMGVGLVMIGYHHFVGGAILP